MSWFILLSSHALEQALYESKILQCAGGVLEMVAGTKFCSLCAKKSSRVVTQSPFRRLEPTFTRFHAKCASDHPCVANFVLDVYFIILEFVFTVTPKLLFC